VRRRSADSSIPILKGSAVMAQRVAVGSMAQSRAALRPKMPAFSQSRDGVQNQRGVTSPSGIKDFPRNIDQLCSRKVRGPAGYPLHNWSWSDRIR
jgi:hypothetical protein